MIHPSINLTEEKIEFAGTGGDMGASIFPMPEVSLYGKKKKKRKGSTSKKPAKVAP